MQTPIGMRVDADMGRDLIGHIDAHVTVHVSTRRVTRWRLCLGAAIMKFGGWITGFQQTTVDISDE